MRSKLLVAATMAALAASACEALVDLNGLDDGPGVCDAACGEAAAADARPGADAEVDAQTANVVDAAAPPDGAAGCPSGRGPAMVMAAGFCIDSTEVTGAEYLAFYNAVTSGTAVVRPAACGWKTSTHSGCGDPTSPIACVDWCDAYAFCAWAGKRLCGTVGGGSLSYSSAGSASVSEWSQACSPDGRIFPYGNTIKPGACDTRYVDGGNAPRAVPVASLPDCVGGIPGLYDMAGNVEEWIDSCDTHQSGLASDNCHEGGDTYDFATTGVARCDNNDNDRRDFTGADVGFRCCASP